MASGIHRYHDLAGKSQELELHSIQSNLLRELDRYTLPSPRGSSKRYINLVIWSRPRVNNCLCLLSHFQLSNFLPSVFLLQLLLAFFCLHWKYLLGFQAVKFNCDCTSGSTGHFCLLPTVQVQLQLYFLTTQAVVVFYQLKFNCSCTSFNYSGSVVHYQLKFNVFQVQLQLYFL
jgi:hypothetical protein